MAKSARENILQKIKQALAKPVPVPFSAVDTASTTYPTTQEDLSVLFAENFSGLQGKFAFCSSEKELASQLSMLFIQRNWKQTYCREIFFDRNVNQSRVWWHAIRRFRIL